MRYKTAEGKKWQKQMALLMSRAYRRKKPYEHDVRVGIVFYTADKRRWDLDNRFKALLDTFMLAHVLKDDSQIKQLIATRLTRNVTKTVVVIEKFGNNEQESDRGISKRFFDPDD